MSRLTRTVRQLALAACLAAPLFAAANVHADSALLCSSLSTSSAEGRPAGELQVTKTQELSRFQARPYVRIPTGVALWVRAPQSMTAADLHNLLSACSKRADNGSPLCVKGAAISVDRSGGSYVVSVTSDDRATALEIQRRARK